MRVVVTGAAGFLGNAIVTRLIDAGVECLGVSRKHIPGFLQVSCYSDTPPGDVLIHLAEINDRMLANRLSTEYEREASSTLEALLGKGYGSVVYVSSAVLYGDGQCSPHRETDPASAVDTYTRVKINAEQRVLSQNGSVARLANVYGPGMSMSNVLSRILGQLDRDGPVTLQDTTPVRDFIWIEDAAAAIMKMATEQAQGLFNIGTGIGTSIGKLARLLLDEAKQTERKVVSKQADARQSCLILDITKAKQYLNWQPSVSLNEGLLRLVCSHRELEHA